ncbi:MAG: (d)CMP kinase [Bacteroidales bacterium]|nr:(d)CMP kinase [Bacteroidales bacterium]
MRNTFPDNLIIAIDGYASSGKSTLAKDLARVLNYRYIDTGAMYRGVAFFAEKNGCFTEQGIDEDCLRKFLPNVHLSFENINGKSHLILNGKDIESDIRTMVIAGKASEVSTIGFVREFLVAQQQKIGKEGRLVMDGRDIGTVVFPHADIKFFVEALLDVRTLRRFKELQEKKQGVSIETVRASLKERDLRDTTREISPLKKAEDAVLIDNTNMTKMEQLDIALAIIDKKVR